MRAAQRVISAGPTTFAMKEFIAALCGVPTILYDKEVVVDIDDHILCTDKNTYFVRYLREDIKIGDILYRGEPLGSEIKFYPFYTRSISSDSSLDISIKTLPISNGMVSVKLNNSIYARNDNVPIQFSGFDKNGNPKLWFSLDGNEFDVKSFWNNVWSNFESHNKSMANCFNGIDCDTIFPSGLTGKTVNPRNYFLDNFIGANTFLVSIDVDLLDHDMLIFECGFLSALVNYFPSNLKILVFGHLNITDIFDIDDSNEISDNVVLSGNFGASDTFSVNCCTFDSIGIKYNKICK